MFLYVVRWSSSSNSFSNGESDGIITNDDARDGRCPQTSLCDYTGRSYANFLVIGTPNVVIRITSGNPQISFKFC